MASVKSRLKRLEKVMEQGPTCGQCRWYRPYKNTRGMCNRGVIIKTIDYQKRVCFAEVGNKQLACSIYSYG